MNVLGGHVAAQVPNRSRFVSQKYEFEDEVVSQLTQSEAED